MGVNVGQRNIPDTPQAKQCYAVDACMEFALHTQKICKNHKIFTDDYKELRDKIIDTAINIYIASYDANKIKAISQSEKEKRLKLQIAAINSCISMMGFINLAKRSFHLRSGKSEYWVKKLIYAREMLKKWHDADLKRYGM